MEQNNNKVESADPNEEPRPFSSIPGPWPSLPFIGTRWYNFFSSLIGRYDLSNLHELDLERYHMYGPISKEEYQWGVSIVHLYDPKDFETVFKSQGQMPIRPPNEFVSVFRRSRPDHYPNVGLANMNGEEWKEQRHRLVPTIMKLRTIHDNIKDQNDICRDFLDYLWDIRDPETDIVHHVQEATYRLALESICMLCLDTRIGAFFIDTPGGDAEILIEATKLLFETYNKLYHGYPLWKYFKTGPYRDLEQAETLIYNVASKYVNQALNDLSENSSDRKSTVLQNLLNTENFSQGDVKTNIIDFIIGGIFTVSNTFACLFHCLASNQDVQEKLYEEICSVKSDDDDVDSFGISHIAKMPYLKACVTECFRLNCPVPGLMRIIPKPIVLSGYHIPPNTLLFSHFLATCRLEKYFENADQFRPDRWIDPIKKSSIHPFALLPFGYGNRVCIGKRFSETELYLSLAKLIQTYRLELPEGCEETLEMKHSFLVVPAKSIAIRLIRR